MIAPPLLLRLATRSLLVHKLRSFLSMLGVIFGVGAVVAMSSVGEGARREALEQIGALGVDTLTVRRQPVADGRAETSGLRLSEADSIAAVVPETRAVAPVREAVLPASTQARAVDVTVLGTTPAYEAAAQLTIARGRFLTALDVKDRKRTAVLGAEIARTLLPLAEAVGHTIRLGGDWFDVVGVLEPRGGRRSKGGPIRARDVNQVIFVPLPSLDRGTSGGPDGIDEIVIRMADGQAGTSSAELARAVIARTSGGAPVEVLVPREILRQRERTQRIFNVVTGAVAGIGLIVGGIGIMNIMLASVAERTGEIGIRRALGATKSDVAAHFLAESTLLTASGGVLGILLGLLGSVLIQRYAGWATANSPFMLVAALVTALVIGIGFGFYPAWRAAQLTPMEALRRE
jgi:putative ABC transport system permease protein